VVEMALVAGAPARGMTGSTAPMAALLGVLRVVPRYLLPRLPRALGVAVVMLGRPRVDGVVAVPAGSIGTGSLVWVGWLVAPPPLLEVVGRGCPGRVS